MSSECEAPAASVRPRAMECVGGAMEGAGPFGDVFGRDAVHLPPVRATEKGAVVKQRRRECRMGG